jgi:indolepyruvate ferredoxin oxidoreductase beta subunit
MASKVTSVVFAGLGGQGVLRGSDILADAAFRAGMDVKKSELHGMSQRGGSVTSDVRFGCEVLSPMVPPGEADFLIILEPTQQEINLPALKPNGTVISPDTIEEKHLPNRKSLNVALLGVLSAHLDIPESTWLDALRAGFPESLFEGNLKAFETGRAVAD